jgi:hypothetical protein
MDMIILVVAFLAFIALVVAWIAAPTRNRDLLHWQLHAVTARSGAVW